MNNPQKFHNRSVNGERLWASLQRMAEIGATPKGGVCRLALTELDRAARDLFVAWCEDAGCTVRVDAAGNVFARRPGADPERPAVMTGSHLDSQPTGGKYDGAYGVLAGLEVLRTLNDHNIRTRAPLDVVVWTNEEGSRFAPAMVGSGTYAGVFDLDYLRGREDADGVTLGAALDRIGYAGDAPLGVGAYPVGAYFEAHIEQGPILERNGNTVGVVLGAQGQRWYELTLSGQEAHAGPTPMPARRDALVAAAEIVTAVNRIGVERAPHACSTCGMLNVSPNSRNVIPGRVWMTVDLRHPDDAILGDMDAALRRAAAAAAERAGVELALAQIWHFPATPFDPDCVAAVRAAAERGGFRHQDIISGAGHDAVYLAKVAPTGMIFVPCEGGISHNEIENAAADDLAAGANVLLQAMLERAGVVAD